MCGLDVPLDDPRYPTQIDNGVHLVFNGSYNMFMDFFDRDLIEAIVCHDCVLKILELFPAEFRQQFQGGHPISNDGVRCCEYAWVPRPYNEEEGQHDVS
jgi:hypothetical protein